MLHISFLALCPTFAAMGNQMCMLQPECKTHLGMDRVQALVQLPPPPPLLCNGFSEIQVWADEHTARAQGALPNVCRQGTRGEGTYGLGSNIPQPLPEQHKNKPHAMACSWTRSACLSQLKFGCQLMASVPLHVINRTGLERVRSLR